MITEKDCIELLKKYQHEIHTNCVFTDEFLLINDPDLNDSEMVDGGWSLYPFPSGPSIFYLKNFEDVKEEIIDFFLKIDPTLEQQFLNKKHQHILKQPKILEAL